MSLPWPPPHRTAVQKILNDHPPQSNRCEDAASGIVRVATQAGWDANRVFFKSTEGFCIVPLGHDLWPPWQMHVAAETCAHDVDALTGTDGVEVDHYLKAHWQYPECMARYSEEEWQSINQP